MDGGCGWDELRMDAEGRGEDTAEARRHIAQQTNATPNHFIVGLSGPLQGTVQYLQLSSLELKGR